MSKPRFVLGAICALLAACSPTEPDEPALVIEPVETFYQPFYDDFLIDSPVAVALAIDVTVSNVSDESVYLDRCRPSDILPSFDIRGDDGQRSVLLSERVCISAPPYEIPVGTQRTLVFFSHREIGCSPWSCLSFESKTSGYHRLVLSSDGRRYSSRRFYLRAPRYTYE